MCFQDKVADRQLEMTDTGLRLFSLLILAIKYGVYLNIVSFPYKGVSLRMGQEICCRQLTDSLV